MTSSLQPGIAAEDSQQADEQSIIKLFSPEAGATPSLLSGSGFTYRHDWGDRKGEWKLFLSSRAINRNSRVFVAIGECAPGGGKFIGSARYTVHNVAPKDNGVEIWINIQWSEPIRLCVDYFVVNP